MHGQRVCRHGFEEDDNQLSTKFMREETSMNESSVQRKMTGFGNFSPFMGVMESPGEMHIYCSKLHSCPCAMSSCFVQGLASKRAARVDVQELLPALF